MKNIFTIVLIAVFGNILTLKAQPSDAAPKRANTPVVAIFSSADGFNDLFTNFGEGQSASIDASTGSRKYGYKTFQFTKWALQDATPSVSLGGVNYLHMDIWVDVACQKSNIEFWDGSWTGGARKDFRLEAGEWNSIDIPLSELLISTSPIENIRQFQIVGDDWATIPSAFYIDNFYFYFDDISTSIDNLNSNVSVKIYTASNSLVIDTEKPLNNITIFNLTGQKISEIAVNGTAVSFDISGLISGTYVVKAQNKDGSVYTEKIIK